MADVLQVLAILGVMVAMGLMGFMAVAGLAFHSIASETRRAADALEKVVRLLEKKP